MTLELRPHNELDRDLFEMLLVQHASNPNPTYIADVHYDPAQHYERWLAEGQMRTKVNAKIGTAHKLQSKLQRIPGQELTADEIGRVCEGPVELMLGLDVAAVLNDSTDARPDKTIDGIKFDVKGSRVRERNTFSLPQWVAKSDRYDALILVQHIEPGHARVWVAKCEPGAGAWERHSRGSQPGAKPFFVIPCPDPVLQ